MAKKDEKKGGKLSDEEIAARKAAAAQNKVKKDAIMVRCFCNVNFIYVSRAVRECTSSCTVILGCEPVRQRMQQPHYDTRPLLRVK